MIALAAPAPLHIAPRISHLATIADGITPGGQHWHLRARADHGEYTVETSFPFPDGEDGGGFQSSALPSATRPFLVGGQGDGFGRDKDEYEVDGIVSPRATSLRLTTATGTLTFRPRTTPPAALRRYPALRRFKMYIKFFPSEPQRLEALDATGTVIASQAL